MDALKVERSRKKGGEKDKGLSLLIVEVLSDRTKSVAESLRIPFEVNISFVS